MVINNNIVQRSPITNLVDASDDVIYKQINV